MKKHHLKGLLQMKYYFTIIFIMVLGIYGCRDIISPNLKGQKVAVNSPLQNQTIRNYNVTFWWNPMEGAAVYRLQLVQNRFDSLPIFRLDSTTTKTQVTVTLKPGIFQWRLWAENGINNRSDTIMNILRVDSASIREQIIKIKRPALLESFFNQSIPYRIQWEQLPGARRYQIEINNDTTKFSVANFYDLTFTTQMEYNIRVRAIGNGEKTGWSEYYKITYDVNPPGLTKITSPSSDYSEDFKYDLRIEYTVAQDAFRYVVKFFPSSSERKGAPLVTDTVSSNFYRLGKGDFSKADTVTVQVIPLDKANNEGGSDVRKYRNRK